MNRSTTLQSKSFTGNMGRSAKRTSVASVTSGATQACDASLDVKVQSVCQRIAPLWPLDAFVAVSPYFGMRDLDFEKANEKLGHVAQSTLVMPPDYYLAQIKVGRIDKIDIEQALNEYGLNLKGAEVEKILSDNTAFVLPQPVPLVSDVLEKALKAGWNQFVLEQVSQFAAAYFDQGQAIWPMPWQDEPLYDAWRHFAEIDLSPRIVALRGIRAAVAALPARPIDTIALVLQKLAIPQDMVEDYLHATLMSINGWASWTSYLRWEQELVGGQEDSIVALLAIRLAWELLLLNAKQTPQIRQAWEQALQHYAECRTQNNMQLGFALQTAFERSYQKKIIAQLTHTAPSATLSSPGRPSVQAAFCIDVRSEVFRRAFETVSSSVQTIGYAGFFGAPMEFVPLGASKARSHLPVLLTPNWQVYQHIHGANAHELGDVIRYRQRYLHRADNWKAFKNSPSSCFSFVESTGLLYGPKLLRDSFGWSRPVAHPATKGLPTKFIKRLVPSLEAIAHEQRITHTRQKTECPIIGIPNAERGAKAESILKSMSMTANFARLVLLVGHGSSTVNNPHASGLDCGACAGQTGENSARVTAALLNEQQVRQELARKGICIPADTWFVAALHDTTTDEVTLFDIEDLKPTHGHDLQQLRQWFTKASQLARMERSALLGIRNSSPDEVKARVKARSRDWSQVFPEWGLAGNAAFIAAPRSRTRGINLAGRAFLHDYEWREDEGFGVLDLIMTAPMIVANWINMQYYGSVVDNKRFGSGNKVLHNIVGGSIGVLEGNGGDLRVGLPLQSINDGKRWIHEPLRLNVFLEAPKSEIDRIIAKHELVRQLVENRWLYIFQIEEDGIIYLRNQDKQWQRMS